MASADWYTPSGVPGTGAQGSSLDIRNEFGRLETALDKLPTLSGGAGKVIVVNGSASGLEAVTTIAGLTLTTTTLTAPVINGVVTTTGLTLPAFTLGGTVTSNGQTFSGTIADLGIVTTVDINGGTIDGTVVGGSSEAAGSFTTLSASTSITGTLATAAQGNITSLGTLTTLTVDNITLNGNAITSDAAAALTITATAGQVVQVESVTFDAGVVAGATSITSTAFAGDLTGNVTGNTSGTAATVTGATQAAITTTANLTTVGALNAGSITSGFGAIDIGSSTIDTTGAVGTGALTAASITSGGDILSDTDSTDSIGSTAVRWLKGWFDTLTAGTLTIGSGSITDSSGAVSFGNENLSTTGTAATGALTVTGAVNINSSSAAQLGVKGDASGKTVSQFIANDTASTVMAVWERSDGAVSMNLGFDGGTGKFTIGTTTAHDFAIKAGGVEALVFDDATQGGTFSSTLDVSGTFTATTAAVAYHTLRNSHASAPLGVNIDYSAASPDGAGNPFLLCEDSTTIRCRINDDGDVYNHDGTYGTISDRKLKTNFLDATSFTAQFRKLKYHTYQMKTDVLSYGETARRRLGLVVDEVEDIFPRLVSYLPEFETFEDEDGEVLKRQIVIDGVPQEIGAVKSSIIEGPVMAIVLQEALDKIDRLEARLEALEL